jgi:hypothetical protein
MARGRPKSGVSLLDRLLSRIVINDVTDCWEYQGGKNNIGYGMIRDENKMRTTHRVSYEEHKGPIPYGLCVMHSCDNPICCNPNHLSVGTHQQNSDDMVSKGRHNISGSFGMTGKKQPRTTCIHCNQSMPNNTYARFHGDNCKLKQSINTLCTINQQISPQAI